MNYSQAIEYLYSLGNEVLTLKLGLENIRYLLNALDNPQDNIPTILVAGTNGKGSTCAMIDRILREAKIKVGLYTSPHLVRIEERIKVDGKLISREEFAALTTIIRETIEELFAKRVLSSYPTFFEQITAIAFLFFKRCSAEVLVLEVGLGGRLDATNIVDPVVSIITNIGYDHQKYLGNTLAEITREKIAIIRPTSKALIAKTQPLEVIEEVKKFSTNITWVTPLNINKHIEHGKIQVNLFNEQVDLSLRGEFQAQNAALAIEATKSFINNEEKFKACSIMGVKNTEWPGRAELISGSPSLLLDGAHNTDGAYALAHLLKNIQYQPITLVFAAMQDKPAEELLGYFLNVVDKIILTQVTSNIRSYRVSDLIPLANKLWPIDKIYAEETSRLAFIKSKELTPASGLIVIAGSLYLIGEIYDLLNMKF